MSRFVRRPKPVDAVQWTGTNVHQVAELIGVDEHELQRLDCFGLRIVHRGDQYDDGRARFSDVYPTMWIVRPEKGPIAVVGPVFFEDEYVPVEVVPW